MNKQSRRKFSAEFKTKVVLGSIVFIYLIKAAGSPLYGQYNHSNLVIKSYVKSIDSLWLLYEEEDLKNVTKTVLMLVQNTDTVYITALKSVLGDTVYRADYHSTIDKARDESYYLNNNKVILAKQEFNNGSGKFQKIVFFENGTPVIEDMVINNKTLGSIILGAFSLPEQNWTNLTV